MVEKGLQANFTHLLQARNYYRLQFKGQYPNSPVIYNILYIVNQFCSIRDLTQRMSDETNKNTGFMHKSNGKTLICPQNTFQPESCTI